ncbi:MarR family transcriptional regulator [Streptomyces sp. NPDC020801]|uniref:MarR family transcriptional regulator n=1 Tax=unclassified Streptomyces TaxID=2593676 RepID=UPI0037B82E2F
MTTTAPLVDGRVIGLAHYAARAVLESVLERHDVTFRQFVTLRLAATADGTLERARLAGGVAGSLKVPAAEADGTIEELISAGLLAAEEPSRIRITDAGRERYDTGSAETATVADRIYAGIPDEDRAVAGRVLTLVTERAETELGAMTATRR